MAIDIVLLKMKNLNGYELLIVKSYPGRIGRGGYRKLMGMAGDEETAKPFEG